MGQHSIRKLYLRTFFLITFSLLLLYDYFYHKQIIIEIINFRLFNFLSIIHIFWAYLMWEMLVVLIPKLNLYSYSGKHLLKHYIPVNKIDYKKLIEFTKLNGLKALRSAIFWIAFNTPFIILYFLGYLNAIFFYWLFFFYYFFDTFSINVFCIFHLFVTKNKCCNECRIYNWGHFMYCTPLIFIPNFWTYSLLIISVIILIQWEIAVYTHPERFSPVSNQVLQCQHCPHVCRYNPNKKDILTQANNIIKNIKKGG